MSRACVVEGCSRPHKARGYCIGHYKRKHWNKTAKGRAQKAKSARALYLRRAAGVGAPCARAGCRRAANARGLCMVHYVYQWTKTPKGRAWLARKRRDIARRLARGRLKTKSLTDSYIRKALRVRRSAEISPALLEAKRVQIQILRLAKENA